MPEKQVKNGESADARSSEDRAARLGDVEPAGGVADALARVQEAVAEMKETGLQESVEAAIEAIDSDRATRDSAEGDQLATIADALEGALDELEKGKVANLLPVIEQAHSIIQAGSVEP